MCAWVGERPRTAGLAQGVLGRGRDGAGSQRGTEHAAAPGSAAGLRDVRAAAGPDLRRGAADAVAQQEGSLRWIRTHGWRSTRTEPRTGGARPSPRWTWRAGRWWGLRCRPPTKGTRRPGGGCWGRGRGPICTAPGGGGCPCGGRTTSASGCWGRPAGSTWGAAAVADGERHAPEPAGLPPRTRWCLQGAPQRFPGGPEWAAADLGSPAGGRASPTRLASGAGCGLRPAYPTVQPTPKPDYCNGLLGGSGSWPRNRGPTQRTPRCRSPSRRLRRRPCHRGYRRRPARNCRPERGVPAPRPLETGRSLALELSRPQYERFVQHAPRLEVAD